MSEDIMPVGSKLAAFQAFNLILQLNLKGFKHL